MIDPQVEEAMANMLRSNYLAITDDITLKAIRNETVKIMDKLGVPICQVITEYFNENCVRVTVGRFDDSDLIFEFSGKTNA